MPQQSPPAPTKPRRFRVAMLLSHPIQYQAPFLRTLAARPEIELHVFYCSKWGLERYLDEGFGVEVQWDTPLLSGYSAEFLTNYSPVENPSRFFGLINPDIVSRLKTGRYDAVIIHGWTRFSNYLAFLAARLLGLGVLMRAETNLLPDLPWWKRTARRLLLRPLFQGVDGFLAIGQSNADFYRAHGVPEQKIHIVPYVVDNSYFIVRSRGLETERGIVKKALGIPNDLPVVLFAGKLTPSKRPLDLLIAYQRAVHRVRAALVFAGDGPLREQLEKFSTENSLHDVHFTGFLNQSELPQAYAIADIFVLPSGYEPWGLVVNEAMCFGLPVIVSTQVGSRADLVREGVNGYSFPVGDVASLSSRLVSLLTQPDLAHAMGRESRTMIEGWGPNQAADSVVEFLWTIFGPRH